MIGPLVVAIPAAEIRKLHFRRLESAKISALKKSKVNFDKWMVITHEMKRELEWWLNNIAVEHRKFFGEVLNCSGLLSFVLSKFHDP